MRRQIEKKGLLAMRFDKLKRRRCQFGDEIAARLIPIGMLRKSQIAGLLVDIEALPEGRAGAAAAASQIPHPIAAGGIAL